jgi:probable HAF family extracellular repeat protein
MISRNSLEKEGRNFQYAGGFSEFLLNLTFYRTFTLIPGRTRKLKFNLFRKKQIMLKRERTLNWTGLHTKPSTLGLVLLAAFACQSPSAAAQPRSNYSVTDLGPIAPSGINDRGQVCGTGTLPDNGFTDASLYTDGQIKDLGIARPVDSGSWALAINNPGQVVGYSWNFFESRAFLYSNGVMQNLGYLIGPNRLQDNSSFGQGINNRGQVVGYSYLSYSIENLVQHAFLYSDGVMQDLGTLAGSTGSFSQATAINDRDEIVGVSTTASGTKHAFLYKNGSMQDIDGSGNQFSQAIAINKSGKIVGQYSASGVAPYRAFVFRDGDIHDLGTLGGVASVVRAINNQGDIVGNSYTTGTAIEHAFLYHGGKMKDLNNFLDPNSGWILSDAIGINEHGQICGSGTLNGQGHSFLLTPVKEQ